ncbi:MAG: DNA replication/repair protein RecF, partial [Bacteroidota bacterium]
DAPLGMLERIGGVQFRCLRDFQLEFPPGTSVFVGDNGAGKTSVLESVYLLGRARSFRASNLQTIVHTGDEGFSVSGRVEDGDGQSRELALKWVGGKSTGRVDGRDADGLTELARLFPVEVIDTQVQELIREGPSARRRFLDWGVFHVKHAFMDAWRRYQKALRQRNAALKDQADLSVLRAWEAEMGHHGQVLHEARQQYVTELTEGLEDVGADLLGLPISLAYQRGWSSGLSLQEALDRSRERDLLRGTSSAGPHRADLEIRVDGQLARDHASGGQQKLASCALVLGQVRLVGETLGRSPVLLIDDPGAEVADSRLDRLLDWSLSLCEQRFVTGLARGVIDRDADAVFHVEQGCVTRVK